MTPESIASALQEHRAWARNTFPHETLRSVVNHLLSEAKELAAAPDDPEEIADVVMLVAGVVERSGVDLVAAIRAKMEKNRTRKWGPVNAEGFCEHIKAESQAPAREKPCETGSGTRAVISEPGELGGEDKWEDCPDCDDAHSTPGRQPPGWPCPRCGERMTALFGLTKDGASPIGEYLCHECGKKWAEDSAASTTPLLRAALKHDVNWLLALCTAGWTNEDKSRLAGIIERIRAALSLGERTTPPLDAQAPVAWARHLPARVLYARGEYVVVGPSGHGADIAVCPDQRTAIEVAAALNAAPSSREPDPVREALEQARRLNGLHMDEIARLNDAIDELRVALAGREPEGREGTAAFVQSDGRACMNCGAIQPATPDGREG